MSLPEEPKNISGAGLELLIFGMVGVIAPGAVATWYFAPQFFEAATTPKLVVCAAALTWPMIATNTLLVVFRPFGIITKIATGKEYFGIALTFGSIITGVISFCCLIITFLVSLSLRNFIVLLIAAQLVVVLLFRVRGKSRLGAR